MHRSFLPYLVDPVSQTPLTLEAAGTDGDWIESGMLVAGGHRYPIINGVPRFAGEQGENYSRTFGYQWNRWRRLQFEDQNVGRPMAGHTTRMWERITAVNGSLPDSSVIADIGCGPGRFIDVARRKGARVIGIDYSQAVEAAVENFRRDPGVCICQGDALQLPIRAGALDGVFSIGVLHHTPDPFRGLQEMVRSLKADAWLALAVYQKNGYYDSFPVRLWRRVFKTTWPAFGHYPPLIYSYLAGYCLRPLNRIRFLGGVVRSLFPIADLPDLRWTILDTFDSVTPSYQSAHESYEVFHWLKKCGLIDIEPSDWGSTSYHGRRPGNVTIS